MWEIEFYESPTKECPTDEFLRSLHKKDELPYVNRKIDLLRELGNNLQRPHADYLENGIYELRIHVRHKQFRLLYFYFYQEKIIISHGIRKEAKVESSEIKKAIIHKNDYISRHERRK
jgi:phage-related protein